VKNFMLADLADWADFYSIVIQKLHKYCSHKFHRWRRSFYGKSVGNSNFINM